MTTEDPLEEVRLIFREEGKELLARLDEGVLALARAEPLARPPIVEEMMRVAHNLKGAAGSLGLKATTDLSHTLESVLRHPAALQGNATFDLLHESIDALVGSLEDRRISPQGAAALAALEQLLGQLSGAPARPPPSAAAPPTVALRPATTATSAEARADESTRIPLARLSELMLEVGEVSLRLQGAAERTRPLRELARQLTHLGQQLKSELGAHSHLVVQLAATERGIGAALTQLEAEAARDQVAGEALHTSVRTLRLRPLSTLFRQVPRMARDLGRALGKEVQVTVSGASLEVEKNVLDVLADALLHLVRNGMDHGLEAPAERLARNKPAQGQLHLSARVQGSWLVVELADDGGGVDPHRVRRAAVAEGFLSEAQARALSDEAANELIFRPGLSTKETASQVSGRGVGLDAVRSQIEACNGTIRVESRAGQGTTFVLLLPLQTHRTHVLLLRLGAERLALPSQSIWKVTRGGQRSVELSGQAYLMIDQVAVPIVQLSALLWGSAPSRPSESASLVVLRHLGRAVAFAVDELLHDEVVVVRELEKPLVAPPLVAGVALRSAGEVTCVLNPVELVRVAGVHAPLAAPAEVKSAPSRARRVLVVDDSFTLRALEKSILEMAGYSVLLASDGEEALALLEREAVDVVVSDVNMPRRDGFELLSAVRQSPRLRELPFILVTSRSSDADRRRGLDLGASAYVVKSEFDQEILVDAVARLAG